MGDIGGQRNSSLSAGLQMIDISTNISEPTGFYKRAQRLFDNPLTTETVEHTAVSSPELTIMFSPPPETRVPCHIAGCQRTFGRETDQKRHLKEHHGEKKSCPVPGCSWRGTKRQDRVKKHLKKKHPEFVDGKRITFPDLGD